MTTHVESVAGCIFLIFYILVKCHVESYTVGKKVVLVINGMHTGKDR